LRVARALEPTIARVFGLVRGGVGLAQDSLATAQHAKGIVMSDIHEILVAVDFSQGSKAALAQAAFMAQRVGAHLHVLHVWGGPEFVPPDESTSDTTVSSFSRALEAQATRELEKFVNEAKERGIAIEHSFMESGVASSTIVAVAKRHKYDLIVLGTHGRTGVAHALLGSVAERVVRQAHCPVVTVREQTAERTPAIRRILSPVDYSQGSRRALDYASTIARAFRAELDVVHVWDRPSYVAEDVIVHAPDVTQRSLGDLIRENAERQMNDFLASHSGAKNEGSRQFPPHRLLSGEPASTLIGELDKGEYDLVVLGTHGRTGLKRFLLGSIAEKLVRYSPVPVITVPPLRVSDT
jgi:nucleotide-binding universal stress UspA family protein